MEHCYLYGHLLVLVVLLRRGELVGAEDLLLLAHAELGLRILEVVRGVLAAALLFAVLAHRRTVGVQDEHVPRGLPRGLPQKRAFVGRGAREVRNRVHIWAVLVSVPHAVFDCLLLGLHVDALVARGFAAHIANGMVG